MKAYAGKSVWILLILLVIGGIIGSWLGIVLTKLWPEASLLSQMEVVGLPPTTLDLQVLSVTFGFALRLNLLTVIGCFLSYLVYRRL